MYITNNQLFFKLLVLITVNTGYKTLTKTDGTNITNTLYVIINYKINSHKCDIKDSSYKQELFCP